MPGAVSYILQESTDPTFPVGTRIAPGRTSRDRPRRISFNPSIQGNFKARVIAVDASGLMGQPSNLVDFSVLDSNPFPAPPTLVAPANGTSQQLPMALSWTHVPNHARTRLHSCRSPATPRSRTIEASFGVTENRQIVSALTTGPKFWRVRSQHGYIGANEAYTAWSATGTFTVLATPLRMGAVTFPTPSSAAARPAARVELTGPAPAGGATVTLDAPATRHCCRSCPTRVRSRRATRRSTSSSSRPASPTRSAACASGSSRRRRP